MAETNELHAEQVAFWNGPGAERWVANQTRMDATLAEVLQAAVAHAAPHEGESVLDIGCGCGATTLALAAKVGPSGRAIGLDVSAPMLEVARRRSTGTANVAWIRADAATHAFDPASVDLLFSRFGVMFFGDPAAAFANLRRALRPNGRIMFACWRPFPENPWMRVPLHAAYAHVPPLPKLGPEDPGPFSFADPERVTRILTQAGFAEPRFTKRDFAMDLANGEGLDAAVRQATGFGPASRAMEDQPEAARDAAIDAIRTALAPYAKSNGQVALPAAIWLVDSAPA
ncbi:MAG: methyltransferase domain-containing protein [Alphaproteobacteria bacterium]|nr:methyltransferase domain-containing protein [Alphaproteobacteria bacterium]